MQLNRKISGNVRKTLAIVTANLFAITGVAAQSNAGTASAESDVAAALDDTQSDLGTVRIDSAVLFYQESGGRVQAIEPVASIEYNDTNGDKWTGRVTLDSLTGASPNGAAPWRLPQTFETPAQGPGKTTTTTGSSGHSTLVKTPGGQIVRQYTVAGNSLPVDAGFRDHRIAANIGYSTLLDPDTRISVGIDGSFESDYRSYSGSLGISRDFAGKSTTASLGVNFEYDQSQPHYGIPTPFSTMSGAAKGPNQSKKVYSLVAGITQTMSRLWLLQLNYSVGSSRGYQIDPYRIISSVDPLTGGPVKYLYENRPTSRLRQSVYLGNKIALGPTVADISGRYYHDSWGINAYTVEASEHVPVGGGIYVEPFGRYYHQSAANFFRNFLVDGAALPKFASSDSRLDTFNAQTLGLKLGMKVLDEGEIYLVGEDYRQTGTDHPASAIGDLKNQKLFSGIKAKSVILGFRFTFR